jgi:hypothetical protein
MTTKLISSFIISEGTLYQDTTMNKDEEIVFNYLSAHFESVQFKPTIYSIGERIKRSYRPCFVLHFAEHPLLSIIVEVDNQYHMDRDPELEVSRMIGIMNTYNKDWTYFIRFNPSEYMMDDVINTLGIESRLKPLYNRIKQICYLSRMRNDTTVPMDQRVFYLFYPEHRIHQLTFEFFAQTE